MVWVSDIIQGILAGGLYALFACGLSLLFGVMKVVNLAHGDLAVVGAYIGIGIIAVTHMPFLWSIPVVCVLMAVLGYVLQRSLIQAALNRGELTTLIVTFGLSIVIENGLQQFFTANTARLRRRRHRSSTSSFSIGSQIQIGWLPVIIFAVAVIVLLALQYFLSGVQVRPDDPGRRRRPGGGAAVRGVNRHVFGIAAALAFATVALGRAWPSAMSGTVAPTHGTDTILLFAFAAVVIGGLGSLWGTLLGGIVLGVAQADRRPDQHLVRAARPGTPSSCWSSCSGRRA